jgi:transposase
LPLNYRGFDASVLSEFRDRLIRNKGERKIFDAVLEKMKVAGMLKGRGLQRTDSLLIVGAVRDINQLELVMETLRKALIAIAKEDAQWLKNNITASWIETYGGWTQAERLEKGPKGKAEMASLQTAQDGYQLLEKIAATQMSKLEAVATLWRQQFKKKKVVLLMCCFAIS